MPSKFSIRALWWGCRILLIYISHRKCKGYGTDKAEQDHFQVLQPFLKATIRPARKKGALRTRNH
jgi:hypothetical protein